MILYTVAYLDQVLEGLDKDREFMEVEIEGIQMQIEPINLTQGRLVRVISTDPQQYLNNKWQPGTIIHFSPCNSQV